MSHLRSFDLIWLQLILILPLLTAIPLRLLGFDATDYSQTGIIRSGVIFVMLLLVSVFLGMLWNRKVFLRSMAIFWGIFIVFYTTFFTHGEGVFKGIVGALGYWLSQQAVERGTQPLYYYAFVQIPIYEFLPAFGVLVAFVIGLRKRLFFGSTADNFTPLPIEELSDEISDDYEPEEFLDEVPESELLEDSAELDLLDQEIIEETQPQPWYQRIFPEVEETWRAGD